MEECKQFHEAMGKCTEENVTVGQSKENYE